MNILKIITEIIGLQRIKKWWHDFNDVSRLEEDEREINEFVSRQSQYRDYYRDERAKTDSIGDTLDELDELDEFDRFL
jgi:hypothetical protein